jgi:hypothetical protein
MHVWLILFVAPHIDMEESELRPYTAAGQEKPPSFPSDERQSPVAREDDGIRARPIHVSRIGTRTPNSGIERVITLLRPSPSLPSIGLADLSLKGCSRKSSRLAPAFLQDNR